MTEKFKVEGGKKLSGTIKAGGSKNAAFPILAATILLSNKIILENVPNISDVTCFINILKILGANIQYIHANKLLIDTSNLNSHKIPIKFGKKIRGSYYFLGALISRFEKASIPHPGGCNIGKRPMDLHFKYLNKLDCSFKISNNAINACRQKSIKKKNIIILPFPSRGTTINLILSAVLRLGYSLKLVNPNLSPETISLVNFLKSGGAQISIQKNVLYIVGVKAINVRKFSIMSDKIEVATFLAAGAITGSKITVTNVNIEHIQPFLTKISEIGIRYKYSLTTITLLNSSLVRSTNVIASHQNYTFDADFEPILTALLCKIEDYSYVQDSINPERHRNFLPQIEKTGIKIKYISNSEALILGKKNITAKNSICKDIRGGVALLLLAISTKGKTILKNVFQIDRGYESIDKKLKSLGANIIRYK